MDFNGRQADGRALSFQQLPTKWNKDNKGAWRMYLPVDIEDTYDDRCKDEIDKNNYQVDTGDRESESSMSVSSN